MKKIVLIIIGLLLICFFGSVYLHRQEQEAWFNWRQSGFTIIEEVSQKKKVNNWTDAEANVYYKILRDSLEKGQPSLCPYCCVKRLIE